MEDKLLLFEDIAMDADSSKSMNKGNFKAILEFRALGAPILHEHLKEVLKMPNTDIIISV